MGRPKRGKAIVIAAALAALVSGRASAAAAIRTPASLEIREAATVSVVNSPPLQLLLSSGSDTTFAVTASSTPPANAGAGVTLDGSGAWASSTAGGEVLSVSLADASEEESSTAGNAPQVRLIVAQFN